MTDSDTACGFRAPAERDEDRAARFVIRARRAMCSTLAPAALFVVFAGGTSSAAYASGTRAAEPVQETREAQPLVVNVGAAACVPCRLMAPVLERAARRYEGRARVLVVDIRTNREALKTYGVRILPTQIFFNAAGERVATHEGFLSEAELTRAIDELVAVDK